MKKTAIVITCILIAGGIVFKAQSPKSNYKIANKFSVEGDGGRDYLISDDNTSRLFVSHWLVTNVVDSKTEKLLVTIQDTKRVNDITLAQDENKALLVSAHTYLDSNAFIGSFETANKSLVLANVLKI